MVKAAARGEYGIFGPRSAAVDADATELQCKDSREANGVSQAEVKAWQEAGRMGPKKMQEGKPTRTGR